MNCGQRISINYRELFVDDTGSCGSCVYFEEVYTEDGDALYCSKLSSRIDDNHVCDLYVESSLDLGEI